MKIIKLTKSNEDEYDEKFADRFYAAESEDGVLRCSCGRRLIKLDESTYSCEAGLPIYRFDEGTLFIDKYGRIMLRHKDHPQHKNNTN